MRTVIIPNMISTSLTPKNRGWLALLVVISLVSAACGSGTAAAGDDDLPVVIVTTTILGDIVANIAGEEATVEVLMPLGADPHEFEASAQQAARLRQADLVVANGLALEVGLLDTLEAAEADGVTILRVGDSLDPVPFMGTDVHADEDHADETDVHADEDHADETDVHEEGSLDPHVWMDPVRMAVAVDLIAAELDNIADGDFLARGEQYRAELEGLHETIESMIGTVPEEDRKLVTNHFAYGYFADRYGLEMLGTVIPAATTQAETSAAQFAELVEIIEESDVGAIFASTTEPTELAEVLAEEVGRVVQVITLFTGSLGGTGSGAETYVGMMTTSTERIVEGLTS